MTRVFADAQPAAVLNLAAETHVGPLDRQPARRSSTRTSSARSCCSRPHDAFVAGLPAAARDGFRFLHVSTDEVYGTLGRVGPVQRGDALRAELAVCGEQGVAPIIWCAPTSTRSAAGADHELLEQLRSAAVSREADPADDAERARRPAAADLRRRRQRPRLAARRTITAPAFSRCCARARPGEKYNIGGGNERSEPPGRGSRSATRSKSGCPAASNPALRPAVTSYRALKTFVPDRPGSRSPLCDRRDEDPAASWGGSRARRSKPASARPSRWYLEHRDWCEAIQAGRYDRGRLGLGN